MSARLSWLAVALALVTAAGPAQAAQKLFLGHTTDANLGHAPIVVARGMGFFAEEGLDVELVAFKGSANLLPQLISRRVQVGYLKPELLVAARQGGGNGVPLAFFYNMDRASPWEVVVLDVSPVKLLQDLQGRKIGVGAFTYSTLPGLRAMFRELGFGPDTNTALVPVGVGAPAFRALTGGQVDALSISDMQYAAFAEHGTKLRRLELPAKYAGLLSKGFVAHQDMIVRDAETLGAFGRAIAKATLACQTNRRVCVSVYWRYFPDQKPTTGSEDDKLEDAARVLGARLDKLTSFPPDQPVRYGEFPPGGWRGLVDVMHASGQIGTPDVPLESLYTNYLVDAFNRFEPEPVIAAVNGLSTADSTGAQTQ